MDCVRHKADSGAKYKLYFELLMEKIKEYNIEPSHIFNMDEKGFLVGITGRSKRVFNKGEYDRKAIRSAIQDGSREWITVLACICSDGTALLPSLVFQSDAGAIQSSWVDAIDPAKHFVFISSSSSGWSNNDIGLAWLKEVFDRETRWKARSGYRLLLLDGHGSHVTMDFIDYCDRNKILLAVFPPHSTHTLQPLDVGMFGPLSTAYSTELSSHLHRSQGLVPVRKGDFFHLFWRAWETTFTPRLIRSSFEATGISPPNPWVILQRFDKEASDSESALSGDDWIKIESLICRSVQDYNSTEVKKLRRSLHHISAQNSILHGEIRGLKEALLIKKKHQKKSYQLKLNNHEEYHGGAVFWSPKRVRQAHEDEMERQQQKQDQQLQKAEIAHLREQARLYKLQQAQEKRVERERLKEVREKERAKKAAQKELQKAARDAQKAIQLSQKGKRKASGSSHQQKKRQKRVVVVPSHVEAEESAPAPPARSSRSGRNVTLPAKYR